MTEGRRWVRPGVAAKRLGVGLDKLAELPLVKMDVRTPGALLPQWRYCWTSVLDFEIARTEGAK